jgi:hypothetical protein
MAFERQLTRPRERELQRALDRGIARHVGDERLDHQRLTDGRRPPPQEQLVAAARLRRPDVGAERRLHHRRLAMIFPAMGRRRSHPERCDQRHERGQHQQGQRHDPKTGREADSCGGDTRHQEPSMRWPVSTLIA